ncbi:MAG: hypothetical protein HYV60_10460 [Planctomycetia bacterium]|nr:hypothetical protein [Planctomycetia bacterium]
MLLYQESRLLFGLTELKKLRQQKSALQQRLGELADDYAQIVALPLNGMPNSH